MPLTPRLWGTALATAALVASTISPAAGAPGNASDRVDPSAQPLGQPSALLRGELVLVADAERVGPDQHQDGGTNHDHEALRAHLAIDGLAVPIEAAAVSGLAPGSTVTVEVPVPTEVVLAIDTGTPVPVAADAVTDEATVTTTIPASALEAAADVPAPPESDLAAATAVAAATAPGAETVPAQVLAADEPSVATAPGGHTVTVAVVGLGGATDSRYTDAEIDRLVTAASGYWSDQTDGALTFTRVGAVTRYTATTSCANSSALWSEGRERTGFVDGAGKHLLLLLPNDGYKSRGCSYGLGTIGSGPGSGGVTYAADANWTVVAHELGHNLSLHHANALQCGGTPRHDAVQDSSLAFAGCSALDYGDSTNVMSGSAGEAAGNLGVVGLTILGALDATSSRSVTASGTTSVALAPLSALAGLRAAVVTDPRNANTYYLENRQPSGRDTYGWSGTRTTGVTYGIRVLKRGANGTSVLLDPTPHAQSTWYSSEDTDRVIAPGTTWTSVGGGVQLRASAPEPGTGAVTVRVSVAAAGEEHWAGDVAESVLTTDPVTLTPTAGVPFTVTGRATTAAGDAASGIVTAAAAGTVLATATPDTAGRFTLTWSPTAPIANTVVITQVASPGQHAGGSRTVTLAGTHTGATTTTATPVTAQVGQTAVLVVAVTSADAQPSRVTGTVVATAGGVQLAKGLVSSGSATLRLSRLPVGSQTITLDFSPKTAARGAVQLSASLGSVIVNITPLTAAVTTTLKAPSTTVAERATATVAIKAKGAVPSGTVTVLEGDEVLGSGILKSGKAVISLPLLPLGEHALSVTYSGDAAVAASSTAGPTLTVTPKPVSVLTAKASAATTATQATLTVTAKVGSKGATGEVAVSEGGTALGTVRLSSGRGTLKLDRLTAGTHALTLTHADGELFTGGTGTVDVVVTPAKATVKAALVAKTVSAGTGTSVSVVVSSAAGTPTGTVKLLEGSTEVATAELSGGSASLAVPSDLTVGSHRFTVAYSGSSEALATTASAGSLTVRR